MIPVQLKGMRFNRVRFKDKRAFEVGWQNKPYSYDEIGSFFPKENYGVMCGKEVRVLDDDTEKKGLIKIFLDNFGETFRVRDHLYFKFDNEHDKKIIFMNGQYHLGELQGEGTYVVGAGCTHPSGEIYDQRNDLDIITISYDKFVEVFDEFIKKDNVKLGSATNTSTATYNSDDDKFIKSIKTQWAEGNRQDLTMAVAGYLRKSKRLGLNSCISIITSICEDCGDTDINERIGAVRATYDKDEKSVKGYSGLVEKNINITISLREEVLSLMQRKQMGEATERLVEEIEKNNHIYTTNVDNASEVYIYDNGIYIPDGEFKIKEQLREIMLDNYNEMIGNQVMAKIRLDTGISPDKLFSDHDIYEVPVKNGILDLKKCALLPFDHKKIFFSKLPIEYDEEAECKKIDQFLVDVLSSPSDKKVFYELAGFGLVKEYFIEKSFMFVGNGRNGKSKSIDLLKRFVGVGNCASVPLSAITVDSPFVQRLWKRFFNLAGDISSKDMKETGMFKQLTGRDAISANRKYKSIVEFQNYAKMVFACNDLPKVYDYSDGFWERWVLMEFPYKFVDMDIYEKASVLERKNWKIKIPDIIESITTPEEMSGFLNMALKGLHRLLENKKFSYTKGTEEVKNKWVRMADSFMAFCMDCIEQDYSARVTKTELRQKYKDYCTKHKVSGASDRAIKATLQEAFGVSDGLGSVDGSLGVEHYWSGIKFKSDPISQELSDEEMEILDISVQKIL